MIGLTAVLVTTVGCFQSHDRLRERFHELASRDSLTVVYYGEEITGGMWYMQTGIDFDDILAPRLEELTGAKIIWIDSSSYEVTFRQGANRIQDDVLSYRPDIVFLRFGLAEAIVAGLTEDNFRDEIERLYSLFDDYNVMPVVLTTTGFRDANPKQDVLYQRLQSFNEIVMWVAGAHRFPLIDVGGHMNTLLLRNPDRYRSMFTDQTHLNEEGMQYIADFIMKEIRDAVGDLTVE